MEAVAYTYVLSNGPVSFRLITNYPANFPISPKRMLEQIKGISEQKAAKVLVEGTEYPRSRLRFMLSLN